MARVLGLDLGSYSVKGLLTETAKKGAGARTLVEVRRQEGADRAETLRAALQELVGQLPPGHIDQVVVALPGPALATHVLTLPFTDPKRIEATLPFEVEGQLPFDLAEAVFDYQQVGTTKDKGAELLVGVVRREELKALLDVLHAFKLDARVVTHPAVAYQNVLSLSPSPLPAVGPDESVAVVDLGHERTSVALGAPGRGLEAARTFSGGGKDLTRALAAEFNLPLPEAHAWKEQHGAMGSAAVGPDAERAAGALVRGLQPLLRELRPTLKSHTARTRRALARIYICGGTAALPGIDEQLTRDLGIPVERLPVPAEPGATAGGGVAGGVAAAQAWALALRAQAAGPKAPRFNMRRGEFAFQGDFDYLKGKAWLLASMAATLLLLLVTSGVVRNVVLSRREAEVDRVLCDTTKRVIGTCEKDYVRALNLMAGQESPTAALPRKSAVNLMAELTQRIPQGMPVKFEEVIVDPTRVQLRGETATRTQVEELAAAIKGQGCFREVQTGRVEASRDGQKTSFRLDIDVECPAEEGDPQG
jgi:general secretion pathway protein L